MSVAVRAERVSFRYRRNLWALRNFTVSLSHRPTLLIGPNGAGKSTALRLLAGQLVPTEGAVTATGTVGFAPQQPIALPGFSVRSQVRYAAWLVGLSPRQTATAADRALRLSQLSALAGRPATRLSGGELARLGIACAVVGSPQWLLLDEPTAALDPLARRSVAAVYEQLVEDGTRLLVSSHTASDVGPPFERMLVLDRGSLCFAGSREKFFTDRHAHPVVAELAEVLRGS